MATGAPPSSAGEAAPDAPIADAAPSSTLDDHRDRVISETLAACGGNIARAARQLGVSRGLLYRRLRAAPATEASAP